MFLLPLLVLLLIGALVLVMDVFPSREFCWGEEISGTIHSKDLFSVSCLVRDYPLENGKGKEGCHGRLWCLHCEVYFERVSIGMS